MSLDTLRADHVSGFGAAPGATPALERIGREGMRFTESMAEGTWTIPSHFALLYGRLYGFPPARPPLRGLAQLLADDGWATAAFTGGGYVGAYFRFHLGFDRFAEYDASRDGGSDIRSLPEVLADAERWIAQFAAAPSAVFIHTYAVHELTPEEMRWLEEHPLEQFEPSPAWMDARRAASTRTWYRGRMRCWPRSSTGSTRSPPPGPCSWSCSPTTGRRSASTGISVTVTTVHS
jgi:arylsulfatase A-like enzyme